MSELTSTFAQCRQLLFGEEDDFDEAENYSEDASDDEDEDNPDMSRTTSLEDSGQRSRLLRSSPTLYELWDMIHQHQGLFAQMWTDIQANIEMIRSSPDRVSQWRQILQIVQRVVRNSGLPTGGDSWGWGWVTLHLFDLNDAVSEPGIPLTPRGGQAYQAIGPLFDCTYLMVRCAEMMPSYELAQLDAGLFNAIVGDGDGIWSHSDERGEIRDGLPWDRVFGDAVRLCNDAHVPALRLLSAMLLCQPLHIIKRTFSYHRNGDPTSPDDVDWREDNKCLMLRNKLRLDFGPVGIHAKLKDMTDADLLSRWRNLRLVTT
ncbi:hypothetical protein P171DRAFT_460829 [Karstenula rhodostoma CBS 690.94]|uniref:Uncharacterized protein n=1 Tax=Karstenula rhodostoma CBS 690.94 TaxID=1392251 RepID=A0A9P4UHU3_9PLEO|nr:hypothetical protein P171DRAFT_460829 [Karstenula rhodostoma CBS 690.94]